MLRLNIPAQLITKICLVSMPELSNAERRRVEKGGEGVEWKVRGEERGEK